MESVCINTVMSGFGKRFENLNGNYSVEGTNVTIEELLAIENVDNSEIKKH